MHKYFVFEINICLDKFCWIYARHKYTFTLHGFHENSYLVSRASQILKSFEYHWFIVVQDVSTGRCYFRGWRCVRWLRPSCPSISSQTKWTLGHVVFPLSFLGPMTAKLLPNMMATGPALSKKVVVGVGLALNPELAVVYWKLKPRPLKC